MIENLKSYILPSVLTIGGVWYLYILNKGLLVQVSTSSGCFIISTI